MSEDKPPVKNGKNGPIPMWMLYAVLLGGPLGSGYLGAQQGGDDMARLEIKVDQLVLILTELRVAVAVAHQKDPVGGTP